MSKQNQKASGKSIAIQSGRDVIIEGGIRSEDMKAILESQSKLLQIYSADAKVIVESRLKDFEQRILAKFQKTGEANPEAFRDPDFQYLLRRAQHSYARHGDSELGDTLVDMIAARSEATTRNRLMLSLNSAIEVAAVLTPNEFAELSLCFLLKHTLNHNVLSLDAFKEYFAIYITPLLADISREDSSYEYLEAQQCVTIVHIGQVPLGKILTTRYGGIFCNGFTLEELKAHLPDDRKEAFQDSLLLTTCPHDKSKIQFNTQNREKLEELLGNFDLEESSQTSICNLFESKFWSDQDFVSKLSPVIPEFATLWEIWSTTRLRLMSLTSIGIAIGHCNLRRVCNWNADLSIWIK